MYVHLLDEKQKSVLGLLSAIETIADFYLAGGTALALHYGHRESLDLDFFSEVPFEVDVVEEKLQKSGKTEVRQKKESTLLAHFEDFSCSFFRYSHPLLNATVEFQGFIRLASIADLAAMKISAISTRGTKRDFVDLYFICRKDYSLRQNIEFFEEKFKKSSPNLYHVYRSLMYFGDAESDRMPEMFQPADWEEIKQFFDREVNQLMDEQT